MKKLARITSITSGFTLIEILISITVIAVLTGVILGVLNTGGIRSKARDGQRITDLKKIQIALELYYTDTRTYPLQTEWGAIPWSSDVNEVGKLNTKYISVLPVDPSSATSSRSPGDSCCDNTNAGYSYWSDSTGYVISTQMELPDSAKAGPCSDLRNSSSAGCDSCPIPTAAPTPGVCYGVENSL